MSPPALQQLELEIEGALDKVVGLAESFHTLRPIGGRYDHFVAGTDTFAANLAPHLLAFPLENPQHLKLYRVLSDGTPEWLYTLSCLVTFLAVP